jgi:hypothetical protein
MKAQIKLSPHIFPTFQQGVQMKDLNKKKIL